MSSGSLVYLDTNAIILLFETASQESDILEEIIFSDQKRMNLRFVTSQLTFSELMVRPYQERKYQLIQTYFKLQQSGSWLDITPVTARILDLAAVLRSQPFKPKLPDAIHLATAIVSGCTTFLSNDRALRSIESLDHPVSGPLTFLSLAVIRPDLETLIPLWQSLSE